MIQINIGEVTKAAISLKNGEVRLLGLPIGFYCMTKPREEHNGDKRFVERMYECEYQNGRMEYHITAYTLKELKESIVDRINYTSEREIL